jgi:alpha-mannosidase
VLPALQYSALGFETFRDEVLLPAVHPARVAASVAVWHPPEGVHPSVEEARKARGFKPVELGYRWGPVWSTAWFRVRAEVAKELAGRRIGLRFSSGTEATLWQDGRPVHGFDPYRDLALLLSDGPSKGPSKRRTGRTLEFYVEAACNLPLGISTFWWDHPELHARWREKAPGRLEAAELVAYDDELWSFVQRFDLLRKILLELPPESPRAVAIRDGAIDLVRAIDPRDPAGGMRARGGDLARLLRGFDCGTATTCVAIGHAHIDTAWLWPIRETRRKCVRTFANVLALLERFPKFHFMCSQAQQYAWIEEDAPDLFARIATWVRRGRFEPTGAMWVEPDCTCPSGESFVRQLVHGMGWWRARFGDAAPQRMLFLPDTFGFPPCLPQIALLAGLDTFITNKMSWSESNRFPHVSFLWRGLDGSDLLSHLTPGHNYNAPLEPRDLLFGQRNLAVQDGASFTGRAVPIWLQPYGFGDGGGGPTPEQAARAEFSAECEGLPRVAAMRVDAFCGRLHDERERLRDRGRDLPRWDGELYLELHRGTYTSQAWIKRQNRLAESALRDVEMLASFGAPIAARRRAAVRAELDPLWKTVLLCQFHDILPGSSIGEVYADARRDLLRVAEGVERERASLLADIGASCDTRDHVDPWLVRNPASTDRSGVVDLGGTLVAVDAVPACGAVLVDARGSASDAPPVVLERSDDGWRFANAWIEATIDGAGRIARLAMHGHDRVANARGDDDRIQPLNQLVLYEDRPRRWEAWDIDRDYDERPTLVDGPATISVGLRDPLRCELRVERSLGAASRLFQTYRLDAGARRLEIRTEVDWRESRRLLRALFPIDVRATTATFGTQFGALERPTHANTSWDEARFEVPGHAWMDLSEPGFGVAVLDDGKYGRSARGNVLGLSLLRSPEFPEPGADRGEQVMHYAVMPHGGDWRGDGVDAEAEAFREPLRAQRLEAGRRGRSGGGGARRQLAPFRLDVPQQCGVQVAAWKPAEDDRGRILRLVEVRGGRGSVAIRWNGPVGRVEPVDLLERPFAKRADRRRPEAFEHDAKLGRTIVAVRPFQIVTLRVGDP